MSKKAERHPESCLTRRARRTNDMQEGLNLNLVLNGATLLSVLGLGVKVYLAGKAQKTEQPLEVKRADEVTDKLCDERHKDIKDQLDTLLKRKQETAP